MRVEKRLKKKIGYEWVCLNGNTQKGEQIEAWIAVPVKAGSIALNEHTVYFDRVSVISAKKTRSIFAPKNPIGVF